MLILQKPVRCWTKRFMMQPKKTFEPSERTSRTRLDERAIGTSGRQTPPAVRRSRSSGSVRDKGIPRTTLSVTAITPSRTRLPRGAPRPEVFPPRTSPSVVVGRTGEASWASCPVAARWEVAVGAPVAFAPCPRKLVSAREEGGGGGFLGLVSLWLFGLGRRRRSLPL